MSEPRGSVQLDWVYQMLLVIAVFAVATAYAIRWNRAQGRAEVEFAQAQGWVHTFRSDDAQGLMGRLTDVLERALPERKFALESVMTVESGWRKVFLIRYRYKNREAASGVRDSPGSACLIESNRFKIVASPVTVRRRGGSRKDRLPQEAGAIGPEFSRSFTLSSNDPTRAEDVVDESIQRVLLDHLESPLAVSDSSLVVAFGPGSAVVLMWERASSEQWLHLLDLCRRIESAR